MVSDEELIGALIEGIVSQSGDITQDVNTGDTVGMHIEGDGSIVSGTVTDTGDKIELNVVPRNIELEATRNLLELQELIANPTPNEDRISEIHDWFSEKIPIVASIITVCDFAANTGIS